MRNTAGNNIQSQTNQQRELSIQQIELILFSLRARFNNHTIQEIIYSLVQKIQRDTHDVRQRYDPVEAHRQSQRVIQGNGSVLDPPPMFRTRFTQNSRMNPPAQLRNNVYSVSVNSQMKQKKQFQITFAARLFTTTGHNYEVIRFVLPEVTQQQYRCYLDTICNQVITSIQNFLKYQHNIIIEHMNTEQRRSLRTQLIRARDWLPKKCPSLLETFLKFIEKIYHLKDIVEIKYDESLRLYKVFLDVVKSSFVDIQQILNDEDEERNPPPYIGQDARPVPFSSFTPEEKKTIVEFYLELKDVSKVMKELNRTRGANKKWKRESLTSLLKEIIRKALSKVDLAKKRYIPGQEVHFQSTPEFCSRLFESRQLSAIRYELLKFNIAGKVTSSGLTKIINQLNGYFDDGRLSQQATRDSQTSVPKLEESKLENSRRQPVKTEVIDLEDDDDKNSLETNEPKEEPDFGELNYSEHIEIAE